MINHDHAELNRRITAITDFEADYANDLNWAAELITGLLTKYPHLHCQRDDLPQVNPDFAPVTHNVYLKILGSAHVVGFGQSEQETLAICEAYLQAIDYLHEDTP